MNRVAWEPVKGICCERVGEDVTLQVKVIYPLDILPDQPPRVLARRCLKSMDCNQLERPSCVWAGTNPGYDPF